MALHIILQLDKIHGLILRSWGIHVTVAALKHVALDAITRFLAYSMSNFNKLAFEK